jgi:hypothetical protein
MKNTKKIIICAWFLFLIILAGQSFLLSGCSTSKSITSSKTIKDSTWVSKTITPFDTLIKRPGTKVQVSSNIDELTDGQVIQKKLDNVTASLRREGNTIIADCNLDELEMIIRLQKELIEVYKIRETDFKQTEKIPVLQKYIPWYLYPFMSLGGLALLYIIFISIRNYLKPKN